MNKLICFLLFITAFAKASAIDGFSGKVISIIDGNTMEILGADNTIYKLLLYGIDCPELTQEYGDKAKHFLERRLLQKIVHVQLKDKDRKGNYRAVIMHDGADVRIALLKEGLAWTTEKDPLPELEVHRTHAKEKGKGLWQTENPTPPWVYRRQQSIMQPKSS